MTKTNFTREDMTYIKERANYWFDRIVDDFHGTVPKLGDIVFKSTTTFWGQCRRYRNNRFNRMETTSFDIEVSDMILTDMGHLDALLVHEIIHALPNCFDHQAEWQRWANYYGHKFGLDITTKHRSANMSTTREYKISKAKYVVTCGYCGVKTPFQRDCKLLRAIRKGQCWCAMCKSENLTIKVMH